MCRYLFETALGSAHCIFDLWNVAGGGQGRTEEARSLFMRARACVTIVVLRPSVRQTDTERKRERECLFPFFSPSSILRGRNRKTINALSVESAKHGAWTRTANEYRTMSSG